MITVLGAAGHGRELPPIVMLPGLGYPGVLGPWLGELPLDLAGGA